MSTKPSALFPSNHVQDALALIIVTYKTISDLDSGFTRLEFKSKHAAEVIGYGDIEIRRASHWWIFRASGLNKYIAKALSSASKKNQKLVVFISNLSHLHKSIHPSFCENSNSHILIKDLDELFIEASRETHLNDPINDSE